ncbi:MAG: hypothetical protein GY894_00130 [Planctomycetes bacterium]|jgi:hypothetical protein|nr:hypothetical protein [Planctomycetota bacterium]MCP4837757.1 hypothetical protein [Planctomycetota bacterium]
MSRRLVAAVVACGLIGLILLSLRQQRIALIHDMSMLHAQTSLDQAALWRSRAEVAVIIQPATLSIPEDVELRSGLPISERQPIDPAHD